MAAFSFPVSARFIASFISGKFSHWVVLRMYLLYNAIWAAGCGHFTWNIGRYNANEMEILCKWDVLVIWIPCRHGTTSERILNQYYLFRAEPILNKSWTMTEWWLKQSYWFVQPPFGYGSYWFVRPPFGYGSHTYVRIHSHFGSAEPILNQKSLHGCCSMGSRVLPLYQRHMEMTCKHSNWVYSDTT